MKNIFLCALFAWLSITGCFSQNFDWQWARYAQQTPYYKNSASYGWSTACNANVGVYVAGWITDTTILNQDTLIYNPDILKGGQTFYLARYDVNGNVRWARTDGTVTNAYSNANGVACDASGNACITGYFVDTLHFGNAVLTAQGAEQVFVAKYDSLGNALWAKAPLGTGNGTSTGIATDKYNNIYVSGSFSGNNFTFGNTVLVNTGIINAFLLKYDGAGNPLWALCTQGNLYTYGTAVATDDSGNVYMTGYFWGDTFKIGGTVITSPSADSSEHQVYTAKFNSAGNLIWVKTAWVIRGDFQSNSVAADTRGNVYITGAGWDSLYFDSTTFLDNSFFYLAKYDAAGNFKWVKGNQLIKGPPIAGYCVTTDINDNVYFTAGTPFFAGINDTFKIDTTVLLLYYAEYPMVFVELDPNGNVLHAQAFFNGGEYQSWACVDRMGNGYLGGEMTADGYEMAFGHDTTYQSGQENMFIAKFNPDSLACSLGPPAINAETNTICANDSALICAPDNYASYLWNTGQTTACFYTSLAGNYYVTVTDGHGCDATSNTVAITVNTPPQVSVTVYGDTLTANNGITFQWYLNGNLIPGATYNQIIGAKGGDYTVQITDSNGCTNTSNPVVIGGINQLIEAEISIYPNPSVGSWQLAVGGQWAVGNGQWAISNSLINAPFEVYDNTGRIIYESKITSVVTEINLPALASGVYYLRVNTGEGVLVRKLVKM